MAATNCKIIPFPVRRRRVSHCPQCGSQTDLWRLGRLLWGFCDDHQLRWVVADLEENVADTLPDLERLETLSGFAEVSY